MRILSTTTCFRPGGSAVEPGARGSNLKNGELGRRGRQQGGGVLSADFTTGDLATIPGFRLSARGFEGDG